jgi:hypothetical protein
MILISIWVQMAQTILSRITFGSADKYLRHWFTEIQWHDRDKKLPVIPKRVALMDMSLFLLGFSVLAIIGYSGAYYAINLIDSNSFKGAICLLHPKSFAGAINDILNWLYFSTATFATVGYGDISPLSTVARLLAVTQISVSVGTFVMLINTYSMTPDTESDQS